MFFCDLWAADFALKNIEFKSPERLKTCWKMFEFRKKILFCNYTYFQWSFIAGAVAASCCCRWLSGFADFLNILKDFVRHKLTNFQSPLTTVFLQYIVVYREFIIESVSIFAALLQHWSNDVLALSPKCIPPPSPPPPRSFRINWWELVVQHTCHIILYLRPELYFI